MPRYESTIYNICEPSVRLWPVEKFFRSRNMIVRKLGFRIYTAVVRFTRNHQYHAIRGSYRRSGSRCSFSRDRVLGVARRATTNSKQNDIVERANKCGNIRDGRQRHRKRDERQNDRVDGRSVVVSADVPLCSGFCGLSLLNAYVLLAREATRGIR